MVGVCFFFFLNEAVLAVVLWTLRVFFEKGKNTWVSYCMCSKTLFIL